MIDNLEEIKAKADIIEVLSHFLPLRKEGVNYTCTCPFHQEKSASFKVSPQKQIYHCFGCNAGGDVFKFVQEYKQLNFEEAVCEVASLLNLSITQSKRGFHKQPFLEVLDKANTIFKQALESQPQVMQYLHNRGLTKEDFNTFDIGFVPPTLSTHFSLEESKRLCELGLLIQQERGYFAPMQHRISFGLRNFAHKVVGFSCRTHPYHLFKNTAKYINSKESKIFVKSQNLYLLSLAKSAISKEKKALLVEGFLDAIALHKMGFKNAVATCGTAFNATHLSALFRVCDSLRVAFCFDNDNAGEAATLRALEISFRENYFDCAVATLQNSCKDIGEVLQKGEELSLKFQKGFFVYCAKKLQQAQSTKEKDALLAQIKALIAKQKNYYTKRELIMLASRALGIPQTLFTHEKVPQINPKGKLAKSLLKSCEENEDTLNLALNYLEGEELGDLREDFKALARGERTQTLDEISLDETILSFGYEEAKDSIRGILKNFLKTQIQNTEDFEKILILRLRLNALRS